ncbi:hypothetical protein SLS58_001732 [Diplodia intermedia]|uniref:Uncharacterized protein n=1 Tax=Diplodia intermedia TaxID=856260 RepID=A0ABR3U0U8_9PEZI
MAEQVQDVSTESISDSEQLANARRKPAKLAMAKKNAATEAADDAEAMEAAGSTTVRGRRMVPVHQSRIADRPPKKGEKDSSLKIKIELDLEVEVQIYARVKGDVTIGLM